MPVQPSASIEDLFFETERCKPVSIGGKDFGFALFLNPTMTAAVIKLNGDEFRRVIRRDDESDESFATRVADEFFIAFLAAWRINEQLEES